MSLDIPARRANVAALRAKATTEDERWICDEFVRLFDAIEARDRLAADVSVKIEERALEDVTDKAGAEDAEEKSYLTGRIRGLRLAGAMLKDAFPGEALK
jgi:hypothetical protein